MWGISIHLLAIGDAYPGQDVIFHLWDLHMKQGWSVDPQRELKEKFHEVCHQVASLGFKLSQHPESQKWRYAGSVVQ